MKLDRNRSFGQIIGHTENGAMYVQDGVEFDSEGSRIGENGVPLQLDVNTVVEFIPTAAPEKRRGRPRKEPV